jgi:hypothetical protein
MLRALLSTYHGVVQDFRLGRHSLSTATLQSVVDKCAAYDKDPWRGPVGKDGKHPRNPSESTAGSTSDQSNPYDALTKCSFGSHISKWLNACKDTSEYCMVCHNTSNKGRHHTKDCPILKQVGLKLVKRTPADGNEAASRVGESPAPAPAPALPAPAPGPAADGGSTSTPGAFTATTELESYDSGEEFDYEVQDRCIVVNLRAPFLFTRTHLMLPPKLSNLHPNQAAVRLRPRRIHTAFERSSYPSSSSRYFKIRPRTPHPSALRSTQV